MHLLVIGHTAHYLHKGEIVGWGPTVKEINWLARVFERVTHLACFHSGPAPRSALPYDTDRVRFVGVPPAGGLTLKDKARVVLYGPQYLKAIMGNISQADVIHVRCPGSLGMYGMIVLPFIGRKQRWVKYVGNWAPSGKELISFPVSTANAPWPHQQTMLETGKYLSQQELDGMVGSWNAGIIGYYQGGTVINLDGLVNNDIYEYAIRNDLPAYLSREGINYIVDFENTLLEEQRRLRGGYNDPHFLKSLRPIKVFDSDEHFWKNMTLYRIE